MSNTELIAIFDADGRQTEIKPRFKVHEDGDWHMLVFVWVAYMRTNGEKRLILQLRSRVAETYKGHIDAFAGGHVLAYENHLESAMREVREEAGVELQQDELTYLGNYRLENLNSTCKRVIEHFYFCNSPLLLKEFTSTTDVNGFAEVDLEEFEEFIDGVREYVKADARTFDTLNDRQINITQEYISGYSKEIINIFQKSIRAIRLILETGKVDEQIWN